MVAVRFRGVVQRVAHHVCDMGVGEGIGDVARGALAGDQSRTVQQAQAGGDGGDLGVGSGYV